MRINMMQLFLQMMWGVALGVFLGVLAAFSGLVVPRTIDKQRIENYYKCLSNKFALKNKAQAYHKHFLFGRWARAATDIFIWMVFGVIISVFSYATNDGILRWFSLMSILLSLWVSGRILYVPVFYAYTTFLVVGKFISQITIWLLSFPVKWMVKTYLRWLRPPLRMLYDCAKKIIQKYQYKKHQTQIKMRFKNFKYLINKDIISWQKP